LEPRGHLVEKEREREVQEEIARPGEEKAGPSSKLTSGSDHRREEDRLATPQQKKGGGGKKGGKGGLEK